MKTRFFLTTLAMIFASGLTVQAEEPAATVSWITGDALGDWKAVTEMTKPGTVSAKEAVITLGEGTPMTGVVYAGKGTIPTQDYEITFEARKMKGDDFFASLTFPIGDVKTCASWVIGGWGGQCVGISCIQYNAANENETTNWMTFKPEQWYRFRLAVRKNRLQGWIDDKPMFDADIDGKKISMRFGDIEMCQPLGFASYQTEGQIRAFALKKLPPL
jgi:hypothetical protein